MSLVPPRLAQLLGIGALAVVLAGSLVACGNDDGNRDSRVITVTHPATPDPTYVDLGDPGASVGDQRIWNFAGEDEDGNAVDTNWVMTTTAVDYPDTNVETRNTLGVLTWGDLSDSLLLEGVGHYPGEGAVLVPASTLARAIIGGTGQFAGATGWVDSTHLEDGTWTHVFRVES